MLLSLILILRLYSVEAFGGDPEIFLNIENAFLNPAVMSIFPKQVFTTSLLGQPFTDFSAGLFLGNFAFAFGRPEPMIDNEDIQGAMPLEETPKPTNLRLFSGISVGRENISFGISAGYARHSSSIQIFGGEIHKQTQVFSGAVGSFLNYQKFLVDISLPFEYGWNLYQKSVTLQPQIKQVADLLTITPRLRAILKGKFDIGFYTIPKLFHINETPRFGGDIGSFLNFVMKDLNFLFSISFHQIIYPSILFTSGTTFSINKYISLLFGFSERFKKINESEDFTHSVRVGIRTQYKELEIGISTRLEEIQKSININLFFFL